MTDQRIPRTTINKRRKRVSIPLHTRIEKFSEKKKKLSEYIMAIKWLGNAGSHAEGVPRDELSNAFELVEAVLEEIYEGTHRRLSAYSKKVIKRKGPLPN